jgi:hypothetical protein
MAVQTTSTYTNYPFVRGGNPTSIDTQTILQDVARTTPLAIYTVMSRYSASQKLVPLTNINAPETSAIAVCGVNGGNLAAWQAVGDGEFSITIDDTVQDITGIVTTAVVALGDLEGIIASALAGIAGVHYDALANVFTFTSLTTGAKSTISVLSAVSGGTGTDISGAGFLNGTAAALTQGTGADGSDIPAGLTLASVTAAALVAGDVENQSLMNGGDRVIVTENQIVLENSLTLDSVVGSTGKTIREHLNELNIYPQATFNADELQS